MRRERFDADPHAPREAARRARWADGGLASSVVGWDRGRLIPTDEDAEAPRRGRWSQIGIWLSGAFALVMLAAMVASVLGYGQGPTGSEDAPVAADAADHPLEVDLAVADAVAPSAEHLEEYRTALDAAAEVCTESRADLADIARSVSASATRLGTSLSALDVLEAMPAAADEADTTECAVAAFDVFTATFD